VKNSPGNLWEIEHPCPQCGAPVTLEETDHVINCSYCRVRLCVSTEGYPRYYLPPAQDIPSEGLFFVPYWRIRGMEFICQNLEVRNTLLDGTVKASPFVPIPDSLGLRPQACTLRFVPPESPSQYLPPSLSFDEAHGAMDERLTPVLGSARTAGMFLKTFMGETTSVVYAPYSVRDGVLYDALLREPLGQASMPGHAGPLSPAPNHQWTLSFLPALCPNCGWDLRGDNTSIVFTCNNCRTAWHLGARGLTETRFSLAHLPEGSDPDAYLPFWRIRVRSTTGITFQSYADLVRTANLPKVVQEEWEGAALHLWVPAFKAYGELFLRVAKMMTLYPPGHELAEEDEPLAPLLPVTLPVNEALKGLKVIIAILAGAKRKIWPLLKDMAVETDEERLVYIPLLEKGNELVEPRLNLSVMRNALRYGANL
jgi:hypothetical protein